MRKGVRSRRAASVVGAACLAAAVGAAGGCSSASHGAAASSSAASAAAAAQTRDSTPSMTISQALAEIPDTGWNESFLVFSATATVAKLNGSGIDGPYTGLMPLIDELIILGDSQDERQQTSLLGFDPLKASFTVSMLAQLGSSKAHPASVIFGAYDPAAIGRKLTATGYASHGKTDGTALWLHSANSDDPAIYPYVGNTSVPTAVSLSPSRIVVSTDLDTVHALLAPHAAALSTKSNLQGIAGCLGPAVFGLMSRHLYGPDHRGLGSAAGVGLIPSGGKTTFEVCVAAQDSAAAQAMEGQWVTQIRTGTAAHTQFPEKWSKFLLDPQASISAAGPNLVRLTAVLNTQGRAYSPSQAVEDYLAGATATALGLAK